MPWDDPGRDGGRDPWGGRNNSGPPDLDEVVRKLQEKLGALFGGRKGRGGGSAGGGGKARQGPLWALIGVLVVVGLVWEVSYIIQPAERGVVLRFGAYQSTLTPGLNIRLPRPIEYVERINVDQVRSITHRASMLTQDENIVVVEMAVQFNVANVEDYLFNTPDPDGTVKQSMETAIREVIGTSKMDFILTEGRGEIAVAVKELLVDLVDAYGVGVLIDSVNIRGAQAPEEVKSAFDDAIKAREDEQRLINEAEAYRNDVLPRARGAAARIGEEAIAYREQVVAEAEGQAARFDQLRTAYARAPEVTRERLYIETIERVLSETPKVLLDSDSANNMMLLPLDRLLQRSADQSEVDPRDPRGGSSGFASSGGLLPLPGLGSRERPTTRDRERELR